MNKFDKFLKDESVILFNLFAQMLNVAIMTVNFINGKYFLVVLQAFVVAMLVFSLIVFIKNKIKYAVQKGRCEAIDRVIEELNRIDETKLNE